MIARAAITLAAAAACGVMSASYYTELFRLRHAYSSQYVSTTTFDYGSIMSARKRSRNKKRK